MKKFLAFLMTLVMLMSCCAFAEAAEVNSARIVLDDIVVYEGETALLDLSGIGLSLNVYDSEIPSLQLALTAADEDVAGLSVAVEGTQLLLGMTGVSNVYSVEVVDVIEQIAVETNLIEVTEGEELTFIISEEDQQALAELVAEAVAMYAANTETSTEELDGTTYDITTSYLSSEDMAVLMPKAFAILDKYPQLLEGTELESFTKLYETAQPTMGFYVTTYSNETEFNFEITLMHTAFDHAGEEQGLTLILDVDNVLTSENTVDTHAELMFAHNEYEYTLAFNMQFVDNNDSSWVPATEGAIDLFEALADEEQSGVLMMEALTTGINALTAIVESNPALAAMMEAIAAE